MRFEFSAGAIIYREDAVEGLRFLLLLKPNREYDIPKGHIEKGESAEAAARREILEESGLEVYFLPGFRDDNKYFFYRGRQRVSKSVGIFVGRSDTLDVRISEEHIGYEWLAYDDAVRKIKFRNMRALFAKALDYIRRYGEMAGLNREYARLPGSVKGWGLSARLVPGEGPLNARVMAVGQAPGRQEDETLRPFIGRSGQLLGSALSAARIRRDKVYITSVVQFFPPENRMPTDEEVELCLPFLRRQMGIVRPQFIIMLGSLSNRVLVGVESVEKEHGRIVEIGGVRYMTTFHPAAGLRFKRIHQLILEDLRRFGTVIRSESGRRE